MRLYGMADFISGLKERIANYSNHAEAKAWLSKNNKRLEKLFSDFTVIDFIFEPIKDVFRLKGKDCIFRPNVKSDSGRT